MHTGKDEEQSAAEGTFQIMQRKAQKTHQRTHEKRRDRKGNAFHSKHADERGRKKESECV